MMPSKLVSYSHQAILVAVVCFTGNAACSSSDVDDVAGPVATVTVSLASPSIAIAATTQATATTRDASNNTLTGRVVAWTSSNTAVATVNATTGVVTGVAAGTATITATSETKIGTANITVTATGLVVLFGDSFESNNLSFAQNGISWISNASVDVTSAIAKTGTRAARFRQGDSGNWAELRFGGLANLPEVFIQFYIYYPSGTESPSVGPKVVVTGTLNDKFFRLWGAKDADYAANPGNKVGASIWGYQRSARN
jgi:hypothetical protein